MWLIDASDIQCLVGILTRQLKLQVRLREYLETFQTPRSYRAVRAADKSKQAAESRLANA